MKTLLLLVLLPQVHVKGDSMDVFGEGEAARKASREADAAAKRFKSLLGVKPLRGAIVLTKNGRPRRDPKKDLKYARSGARWIWRWEAKGGREPDQTMAHELGHMWFIFWANGTKRRGIPAYGSTLPDWIDEGMASSFEGKGLHRFYANEMKRRLTAGTHLPLRTLFGSIHPDSREVTTKPRIRDRFLFYAESYSVMAFLAEKYRGKSFRSLLKKLKAGKTLESTLGKYGLPKTIASLESEWKAWALR